MKETKEELRFAAVERLQLKMAKLDPASARFELYDKAYDLALNPDRKIDAYLIRNVLRDARRILSRKFKPQIISLNSPAVVTVEDYIHDRAICYNDGPRNLEQISLLNTVTFICENIHKNAGKVLTCMVDGYDINDTAERTKLSQSLVKKIRTKIKKEIKLKFNN